MKTANEFIEELKALYPLFTYKVVGKGYVQIDFQNASTYARIDRPAQNETLDREHKRLEIEHQGEAKYPHLSFFIGFNPPHKPEAIWVKRNGRGDEAIRYHFDDPGMVDIMLQHYDLEAKKALQPDWFFCTGCNEAKPKSEYAYFYFAGSYCKDCKAENPDHYNRAMSESYE